MANVGINYRLPSKMLSAKMWINKNHSHSKIHYLPDSHLVVTSEKAVDVTQHNKDNKTSNNLQVLIGTIF